MPFCASQISGLAASIYQSIGSPSAQSVGYISGWITMSGTLGDLNNKVYSSFALTGDSPCIVDPVYGDLAGEEANLLTLMYQAQYYQGQSISVLANGGTFWTSLSEGDTRVVRTDIVNISKAYLANGQEANRLLRLAIADYIRRITVPQSVDACPPYNSPSP